MQQQHQALLHLQQLGGHLFDLQQQQQQHHHRLRTRTVMPRSVHLRPVRHPTCYEGFGTPNFYFHDSIANKCAYDNLLMRLAGRILVGRRPHSRSSSVELRTGRWGPAGSLQVPQRLLRSSLSCYCCCCDGHHVVATLQNYVQHWVPISLPDLRTCALDRLRCDESL